MTSELLRRIASGEGAHLDFKYAVTDSKKIARSLAAFANTSGGSLLLGVKDNGRIAGVNTDEEYYMIETAAQVFCKPEVKFRVQRWEVKGKVILEIVVDESPHKPHRAPNKDGKPTTYIRVEDENIMVDSLYMKYLRQSSRKSAPVSFGLKHQQVIDLLKENGEASLTKIAKKLRFSAKEAEQMVLDLLSIRAISIKTAPEHSLLFVEQED